MGGGEAAPHLRSVGHIRPGTQAATDSRITALRTAAVLRSWADPGMNSAKRTLTAVCLPSWCFTHIRYAEVAVSWPVAMAALPKQGKTQTCHGYT